MSQTYQYTLYEFHELDEDAKERAIKNYKASGNNYAYCMSRDKIISEIEQCKMMFTHIGDFKC